MKKTKLIVTCIIILIIVSLLTYLNYDKIFSYFTNKEWQIADSIGKLELGNYLALCGTNSNFIVVNNNNVEGYSESLKKNFDETLSNKSVVTCTNNDYCIIGEKDSTNVTVFSGNDIVWKTSISNASILDVYINKNGYAAVVYGQSGYKSLIKILSNTGAELFTSYLASTYALDVAISNDNKILAIAEIDTNGISVESRIKIIDIKDVSESSVKKYELDADVLITSIEYNENNDLVIMTDSGIDILQNNTINELLNFSEESITIADISNKKNIVTVKNLKNGLFDSRVQICIYSFNTSEDTKIYELEKAPNNIYCLKNIIAVDTGNEVIFLNNSGNFVKKCEYVGQLKDLKLFDEGNRAVLVFRDMAEFIKVGGI